MPEDYQRIRFCIEYGHNINVAEIGAVSLTKDVYGQSYAYDEENNVVSTTNLLDQRNHATYDAANNLLTYIQPGRKEKDKYTLAYGGTEADSATTDTVKQKRHLVTQTTTPLGHRTDTVYDKFGNAKSSKVSHRDEATPAIQTSTEYDAKGNYAVSSVDARGNKVTTNTDANRGLVQSVTDPNGQSVTYAYDKANRVTETKAVADGKEYKNT